MQNSNIRAVVPSTVIAIIELHRIDDANLLLLPGRVLSTRTVAGDLGLA